MYLKLDSFNKAYITKVIQRIPNNPKWILADVFTLPEDTVIHYQSEGDQSLGIEYSHPLIHKVKGNIYISHVSGLKNEIGNSMLTRGTPLATYVRQYSKSHLTIKPIVNLDRALSTNSSAIVMNYALLTKLYKYHANQLGLYHEWYNLRYTMWDNIEQIGNRRQHFIVYKMPKVLPSKTILMRHSKSFTVAGLEEFNTNEAFNLLELWRMLETDVESFDMLLSDDTLETTHIVFSEAGAIVVINLKELLDWHDSDPAAARNKLYQFWESIISTRAVNAEKIDTAEVTESSTSNTSEVHDAVQEAIKSQGEAGLLTAAEQKALTKMAAKWTTIQDPKDSNKTIGDLLSEDTSVAIDRKPISKDFSNITDKSMLYSSITTYQSQYIKTMLHKNIIEMIMMLPKAGVIVKDIGLKEINTAATKAVIYTVQTQIVNGPTGTFQMKIPVIKEDGTFFAGGVTYRLDMQKNDLPVVKSKPNEVAISSYYGKQFIQRNGSAVSDYSRYFLRILNKYVEDGTITAVTRGISNANLPDIPRTYNAISASVDNLVIRNKYHLYFNHKKLAKLFTEEEILTAKAEDLLLCGRDLETTDLIAMAMDGTLYQLTNGKYDRLGSVTYLLDESLQDGAIEYTELSLLNRRIPVGLALSYYFGLDKMLDMMQVKYELLPTNIRIPFNSGDFTIKFKDIVYHCLNVSQENMLILGGFTALKNVLSLLRGTDFNNKSAYGSLLSSINITSFHLRELALMRPMFVEPITERVLKVMGEPIDFVELLLKANKMLVTDYVEDVNTSRYKGYERICGMVYTQILAAIRAHRAQGVMSTVGITMNPNAVYLEICGDEATALIEESNPIHQLKEQERFTHSGHGGRSTITMVKNTRGYSVHDVGVVSESTPDSSKTGIGAYTSADPNFINLLGMTKPHDYDEKGGTKVISTSSALAPFITHDDSKRVNYCSIQNSHTVSCNGYVALPYRTGYEEILASRVSDLYVTKAVDDGIVATVTPSMLTIAYEKAGNKNYQLGTRHGTVTGVTIPHNLHTDLKVGDRVEKGDVIVFNSGFFTRGEINKSNVVYTPGVMTRVAMLECSDTLADGCVITSNIAKKFVTPISKLYGIIVDFEKDILNLVDIGAEVNPDTILCTVTHPLGEGYSDTDEAIKGLLALGANNPKATVYGKVTNIEVLYYGKMSDMSASLQKVANAADYRRAKRVKQFELDEAKSGQLDESIRVSKHKLLPNQVAIKIYIDGTLAMNDGDKLVYGNMLKTTVSRVDPANVTSEDGKPVDSYFGYQSNSDRIVDSPDRSLVSNTVQMEINRQMKKMYLDNL